MLLRSDVFFSSSGPVYLQIASRGNHLNYTAMGSTGPYQVLEKSTKKKKRRRNAQKPPSSQVHREPVSWSYFLGVKKGGLPSWSEKV